MTLEECDEAYDALLVLPPIVRCAVLTRALLIDDREATLKAFAELLAIVSVTAQRLPDEQRISLALTMVEEARRVLSKWVQ